MDDHIDRTAALPTEEFRSRLNDRTVGGVMLNLASTLVDIKSQLSPVINKNGKTTRDVAGGDAYRAAVDLVEAVANGNVSKDILLDQGYLGDGGEKILTELINDISLRMSEEPIQNERLKQQTQRAGTIAQSLKDKGVTSDEWSKWQSEFDKVITN